MTRPLCTLITYCYNGERFVDKYFDALLAQTYPNVELFFYNNGSEDGTGAIAESYRQRLVDKGYIVNIEHFKKNQVTCSLKQDAMQRMHGEYFCGCDSDDIMYPQHIEKMVDYLQANADKGMVYCDLRIIEEDTGATKGTMHIKPQTVSRGGFVDCLMSRNISFTAIAYMMRTSTWDSICKTREVYQTTYGENYQLQLPFLYNDLQGYIAETLGDYLVRSDSYTAKLRDYRKNLAALRAQETTIEETLIRFDCPDREQYCLLARRRLRADQLFIALGNGTRDELRECKSALKEVGGLTMRIRLRSNRVVDRLIKKVRHR
ncbi:MAG: glycosyltransferase family A protein [Eubacteriales bacterium]|nr:glycosyltransferase family A protein [Eubacteriales bacterium]